MILTDIVEDEKSRVLQVQLNEGQYKIYYRSTPDPQIAALLRDEEYLRKTCTVYSERFQRVDLDIGFGIQELYCEAQNLV
jgi:hypothetical protein